LQVSDFDTKGSRLVYQLKDRNKNDSIMIIEIIKITKLRVHLCPALCDVWVYGTKNGCLDPWIFSPNALLYKFKNCQI